MDEVKKHKKTNASLLQMIHANCVWSKLYGFWRVRVLAQRTSIFYCQETKISVGNSIALYMPSVVTQYTWTVSAGPTVWNSLPDSLRDPVIIQTTSSACWKRFCFQRTSAISALDVLQWCTLQNLHFTYLTYCQHGRAGPYRHAEFCCHSVASWRLDHMYIIIIIIFIHIVFTVWVDERNFNVITAITIVDERLVTPLFWNGFSAIPSLFFVINRKE